MRCRRRRSEKAVIWHNMEWSITLLTISKTELSIFHLGMNRGRSLWICLAPDYFPGRRRDSWISCGIWNDHTGTDRLWGIQDVVSHFEKDSNRKRNLCRGAASWELWFLSDICSLTVSIRHLNHVWPEFAISYTSILQKSTRSLRKSRCRSQNLPALRERPLPQMERSISDPEKRRDLRYLPKTNRDTWWRKITGALYAWNEKQHYLIF